MSFITVRGLRKTYHMGKTTVHALAGVDVDIDEGSFTMVMGPSGSGKSTLMHLVGGLDRPTAGTIEVDGERLDTMDENQLAHYRQQKVGFIFQSFNLVSSMTALENVIFPLRFSATPASERKDRASALLKRVGLAKRAFHKPTELSGGQQQRVAIARAMINQPKIVMGDEPTGNLDTHSGVAVMQMLAELNKQGHTIMVVTHDMRMRQFATQMIFLLDGRIVTEQEFDDASKFEVETQEKEALSYEN
ncbi:MAG TPA: ABC transporter ATP-binding protein [Bellilinea sp.]|nr:ABC transporter ATP-binding protein [Bellilinea sp.]